MGQAPSLRLENQSNHLNLEYLDILTEKGSLTDLFTNLMGQPPRLNCLAQGRGPVSRQEGYVLNIGPRVFAHIREITMGTQAKDWLFARTVMPSQTLTGKARRLKKMGSTPLGKVLFGSLNADRVQMNLDLVFANEVGLEGWDIPSDFPLWQRTSLFELKTGPLLINEILLPDCPIYETSKQQ